MKLDSTDKRILEVIQENGRLSNRELADQVSLSPSPCWRRLKDLEANGVIRGYAALLDPDAIELGLMAFTHISLDNHHPETLSAFHDSVTNLSEVMECHMTSGEHDYTLKVITKDLAAYQSFLSNKLMTVKGVRTVNTSFSLRRYKMTTALPL